MFMTSFWSMLTQNCMLPLDLYYYCFCMLKCVHDVFPVALQAYTYATASPDRIYKDAHSYRILILTINIFFMSANYRPTRPDVVTLIYLPLSTSMYIILPT